MFWSSTVHLEVNLMLKIERDVLLCSSVLVLCSCSSKVFCDSERNILKENDIVRFPKLADTYERIAEGGADVFYSGSMARSIVDDVKQAGTCCTDPHHCPEEQDLGYQEQNGHS